MRFGTLQSASVAALAKHNTTKEGQTMDTSKKLDHFTAQWFDICAGRDFIPETETAKQVRLNMATALIIQFLAVED